MTTECEPPDVETCMAGMAKGDSAFLFALLTACRPKLVAQVRRILADLNRSDLAGRDDIVEGLVIEAGFVLFDRARSWRPGGAAPWRWAQRAIRARVVAEIGHPSADLDTAGIDGPAMAPAAGAEPGIVDLAASHPEVRLLVDTLVEVTSERNAAVFLDFVAQKGAGDPSPSHTVAAEHDLEPATVRQIHRRTRLALVQAAERPGYEGLRDLACLGA